MLTIARRLMLLNYRLIKLHVYKWGSISICLESINIIDYCPYYTVLELTKQKSGRALFNYEMKTVSNILYASMYCEDFQILSTLQFRRTTIEFLLDNYLFEIVYFLTWPREYILSHWNTILYNLYFIYNLKFVAVVIAEVEMHVYNNHIFYNVF